MARRKPGETMPRHYISFCRGGNGQLKMHQADAMRTLRIGIVIAVR